MSDPGRPDPDALLETVRRDEAKAKRGRLKVFIGMAPGVGKTFAMLQAAQRLRTAGTDVVVGYVETHGRAETDALLAGLPAVPRRSMLHRGVALSEMDLDALIARRPAVALVDELAHTNAPGSRHPKRYQDVAELLDAGIDVLSTLNVQHLESCADTVRDITGVTVHETVPDGALDDADVEVVDVSPENLLRRFGEGKVYMPERAAAAMGSFFREGNLVALREIALRVAAERAGQDVRDYMQAQGIAGPWKTGHRLLVAVGPSPFSEQMVRWTRRLADGMKCPWIAAHVETSRALRGEEQRRLARNLELAKSLGAEVRTTVDEDVVRGLLRIARGQNVTQIVVGKPERGFGLPWRSAALLRRLVRESGDIDLHIVRVDPDTLERRKVHARLPAPSEWRGYAEAVLAVLGLTLVNLLLSRLIGVRSVGLLFLLGVVGIAMRLGRGPVYAAALMSAALWNFLFLPPRFTFHISSFEDAMMHATFFIVAIAMGHLIAQIRARERMDRRREERATAMYLLTLELADAGGREEILRVAVQNVERFFHATASVWLPDAAGKLSGPADEKERATAQWAFDHNKAAGRHTDTLPAARAMYLPLAGSSGVQGALAIDWPQDVPPSPEQAGMLEAFQRHIALVLDRYRLREAEAEARIHKASEKLQAALLDSISHELKTPLAVIASAGDQLPANDLVREIRVAVRRMVRVVDQLLDLTRLKSGLLRLKVEACDVGELLHTAAQDLGERLQRHRVVFDVAEDLPPLQLDFQLIKQAVENLLGNAAGYAPEGSEIHVSAHQERGDVVLAVADRGPGLQPDECKKAFDSFYRGASAKPGGLGLGLSIARRLVEAHDGTVLAENRPGGGAVFSLRIPMKPAVVPV